MSNLSWTYVKLWWNHVEIMLTFVLTSCWTCCSFAELMLMLCWNYVESMMNFMLVSCSIYVEIMFNVCQHYGEFVLTLCQHMLKSFKTYVEFMSAWCWYSVNTLMRLCWHYVELLPTICCTSTSTPSIAQLCMVVGLDAILPRMPQGSSEKIRVMLRKNNRHASSLQITC